VVRQGILFLPQQLFGTITHVSTREPLVALTFDDGPHPHHTPRLLEILEQFGARATFFVIGESARKHADLVRRMAAAGHAIGNHSWNHPSFPAIGSRERRWQIQACEEVIAPYSQKIFRPPYGNQVFASRLDAWRLGLRVVTWSTVGRDWQDDSADTVFKRLTEGLRPGCIMLLHDALHTAEDERFVSREATLEAVRRLLEAHARSYRFVTVPELLRCGRVQKRWWYQPGEAGYLAALHQASS
jgi:peptidoglycan/xylan/chitin deacetylase (PgdA/CDA1 family)